MLTENKETRETLRKIVEEFHETLVETKNNEACESPILGKINAHRRLEVYLPIKEILNAKKKNMNSYWDKKRKTQKTVFFKQYRNARLNEIIQKELKNEKPQAPRKFLPVTRDHES